MQTTGKVSFGLNRDSYLSPNDQAMPEASLGGIAQVVNRITRRPFDASDVIMVLNPNGTDFTRICQANNACLQARYAESVRIATANGVSVTRSFDQEKAEQKKRIVSDRLLSFIQQAWNDYMIKAEGAAALSARTTGNRSAVPPCEMPADLESQCSGSPYYAQLKEKLSARFPGSTQGASGPAILNQAFTAALGRLSNLSFTCASGRNVGFNEYFANKAKLPLKSSTILGARLSNAPDAKRLRDVFNSDTSLSSRVYNNCGSQPQVRCGIAELVRSFKRFQYGPSSAVDALTVDQLADDNDPDAFVILNLIKTEPLSRFFFDSSKGFQLLLSAADRAETTTLTQLISDPANADIVPYQLAQSCRDFTSTVRLAFCAQDNVIPSLMGDGQNVLTPAHLKPSDLAGVDATAGSDAAMGFVCEQAALVRSRTPAPRFPLQGTFGRNETRSQLPEYAPGWSMGPSSITPSTREGEFNPTQHSLICNSREPLTPDLVRRDMDQDESEKTAAYASAVAVQASDFRNAVITSGNCTGPVPASEFTISSSSYGCSNGGSSYGISGSYTVGSGLGYSFGTDRVRTLVAPIDLNTRIDVRDITATMPSLNVVSVDDKARAGDGSAANTAVTPSATRSTDALGAYNAQMNSSTRNILNSFFEPTANNSEPRPLAAPTSFTAPRANDSAPVVEPAAVVAAPAAATLTPEIESQRQQIAALTRQIQDLSSRQRVTSVQADSAKKAEDDAALSDALLNDEQTSVDGTQGPGRSNGRVASRSIASTTASVVDARLQPTGSPGIVLGSGNAQANPLNPNLGSGTIAGGSINNGGGSAAAVGGGPLAGPVGGPSALGSTVTTGNGAAIGSTGLNLVATGGSAGARSSSIVSGSSTVQTEQSLEQVIRRKIAERNGDTGAVAVDMDIKPLSGDRISITVDGQVVILDRQQLASTTLRQTLASLAIARSGVRLADLRNQLMAARGEGR